MSIEHLPFVILYYSLGVLFGYSWVKSRNYESKSSMLTGFLAVINVYPLIILTAVYLAGKAEKWVFEDVENYN